MLTPVVPVAILWVQLINDGLTVPLEDKVLTCECKTCSITALFLIPVTDVKGEVMTGGWHVELSAAILFNIWHALITLSRNVVARMMKTKYYKPHSICCYISCSTEPEALYATLNQAKVKPAILKLVSP